MTRILVAGLPRSGTTWLAEIIAAAPRVRYSFEPDNWEREPLTWSMARRLSSTPDLSPGEPAERYRLLWEFGFAGGWSSQGLAAARIVHRLAADQRLPVRIRVAIYWRAARIITRPPRNTEHHLVKTVFACHSLEWIEAEFHPTVVLVWRHPLNLVPSWRERGWGPDFFLGAARSIRARFEHSAMWPPPREGFGRIAWVVCAESALLLETAHKHPDWLVVSHEGLTLDPPHGFRSLFARLGIAWPDELDRRLALTNAPGSGWETQRRWAEEPLRWREKLTAEEQREVLDLVRGFEQISPIA
ncbi:MAG: sulfotransferase, partial [Actinomycetota bacterium]